MRVRSLFVNTVRTRRIRSCRVAIKDLGEWADSCGAVLGDSGDCGADVARVGRVGGEQRADVDEVAPAGVGGASLQGGDDLLGEDHGDGVSDDLYRLGSEESWNVDHCRFGPDGVAEVDVEVEVEPGCRD